MADLSQIPTDQLLQMLGQGQPQPQAAPPQQPQNGLDTFVRNAANATTFNLADPLAAAADATIPGINDKASHAPTWQQRYQQNVDAQRHLTASEQQQNPGTAFAGSVAGGIANPVNKVLPVPSSILGSVGQGAALGAGYGAGGAVGTGSDASGYGKDALTGALTGGAVGAGGHVLAGLLKGAARSPAAKTLADAGVPLTMGQSLGGTAKTLEDATTHVPMLGNAIKGRQGDAIEAFNRATYDRTLEPLGLKYAYPGSAPVGNEGIQRVGSIIGQAYDQAYQGATIKQTPKFSGALTQAIQDADDALPKDRVTQITKNINTRLIGKFNTNGELNNDDLISAKNWFAEQSRSGPMASIDEKNIAKAYGSVVDAIKDGIAETDPDKGALLNAADNSYMRYVKLGQAASQNQASGRGGIFTPSQLGAAIRTTDNSTRRMNFAKGTAPMQDLAQAGQQVLPSSVPDSGTALRGMLEMGGAGVLGHEVSPAATMGAAGLIGGGTALYSKTGQKLANALLFGAPGARKATAAALVPLLRGSVAPLASGAASNSSGQ